MTDPMKYDPSSDGRKATPVYSGVVRYFPAALALVSKVSKAGNDKHSGEGVPLRHVRGKSCDHADAIARHLADIGTRDEFNLDHAVAVAWRALALLQELAEREHGWPTAPAAHIEAGAEAEGAPAPLTRRMPRVGEAYRGGSGRLYTVLTVFPHGGTRCSTPYVEYTSGGWDLIAALHTSYELERAVLAVGDKLLARQRYLPAIVTVDSVAPDGSFTIEEHSGRFVFTKAYFTVL